MDKQAAYNVYRCVSGEHEGLTYRMAAIKLGVSLHVVISTLKSLKAECPGLFPILTPKEHLVNVMRNRGASTPEIARLMGVSERRVQQIGEALNRKGRALLPLPKTVRYEPGMDSQVREKF